MVMNDAILLVDKPVGITSFDVIRRLRKTYIQKNLTVPKMGHAGTLDPSASGLMIIGVGSEGTKQLTNLTSLDKTYQVTIELGVRTDSGDKEGNSIERMDIVHVPCDADIHSACASCVGECLLPVPRYSAVKVGGEPLYKKARRGDVFDPPVRSMYVHDIRVLDIRTDKTSAFIDIEMDVMSGVYVRSVVEEIGRHIVIPTTTALLRRTRIGPYNIEDAYRID